MWAVVGCVLAVAVVTAKKPALAAEKTDKGQKPNIVLINMDNFGCGEIGVYGGGITRGAPTPPIDKLASERLHLTNVNVDSD